MVHAGQLHGFEDTQREQRFLLHALLPAAGVLLAAGLMLEASEGYGGSTMFAGQAPIIDRAMEWRPQGPPPAFDVDQLTPEEIEQPVPEAMAAGSSEMTGRDNSNLRARPER